MKCKFFDDCKLFEKDMVEEYCNLNGVLESSQKRFVECFKEKYCDDSFKECARYKVATILGKEKVPDTLLPSQNKIVDKLISQAN